MSIKFFFLDDGIRVEFRGVAVMTETATTAITAKTVTVASSSCILQD